MTGALALLLLQAAAPASAPVPGRAEGPLNPHAHVLFDRDSELRQWAVRLYDRNRDGWLTLYEAQAALVGLKDIADGDGDGRVTTAEYRRAKEFIAARW